MSKIRLHGSGTFEMMMSGNNTFEMTVYCSCRMQIVVSVLLL